MGSKGAIGSSSSDGCSSMRWAKALLFVVGTAAIALGVASLSSLGRMDEGGTTAVPAASPHGATTTPAPPPAPPTGAAPASAPTGPPTSAPTGGLPTPRPAAANPTPAPTVDPTAGPRYPGYFNYDASDDLYGPGGWDRVDTSTHPLVEFTNRGFGPYRGHLDEMDPLKNQCGNPTLTQSPIDLKLSEGFCADSHEIRSICGSRGVNNERYRYQILPNKLSMVPSRRKCLDLSDSSCSEGRPPIADFPNFSTRLTQFSDLINFDVKVPGEHTFDGESFDAEIQMLHTQIDPDPPRLASIGVPVRATWNGFNSEFQQILDAFQRTYDGNADLCEEGSRRRRLPPLLRGGRGRTHRGLRGLGRNATSRDLKQDDKARAIPQDVKFDPYSPAFLPGMHYSRYDGTMTEPPCAAVTWWVMSDPMIISWDQLQQIKLLLFRNRDPQGSCDRTTVRDEDRGVARPIQDAPDDYLRQVQNCGPGTIPPDEGDARRCN